MIEQNRFIYHGAAMIRKGCSTPIVLVTVADLDAAYGADVAENNQVKIVFFFSGLL